MKKKKKTILCFRSEELNGHGEESVMLKLENTENLPTNTGVEKENSKTAC